MFVLIAEDDADMRRILKLYLEKEGYRVETAADGRAAVEILTERPADLVILDWMMPVQDGIQTCRQIREMGIPAKVLMLTAKGQTKDEIAALSCGADDYLRKPFDIQVLLLRARKLCRAENLLRRGDVALDQDRREVTRKGETVPLTRREYELLRYFLLNQRIVLSREILLDRIWGPEFDGDLRAVDTTVRRLRKKLGDDIVATRVGMGYVMEGMG